MNLDHKRLVPTGASSGIGRALLRQLSRLPVQAVTVGSEETRLREAVDAAGATQARILPFPCDLARQEEVDRLFAYAVEQMGGIDMFFANAGFAYWERIGAPDWWRIEAIFQTNVYSPICAAQKMEALFPGADYQVVITSSILGRIGLQGYGLYAATKTALDRFTEVYRLERGKDCAASKMTGRRSTLPGSCGPCCWSITCCPLPGAGTRRSTAGSSDGTGQAKRKASPTMSDKRASVWILGDQLLAQDPALAAAEQDHARENLRVVLVENAARSRRLPYQREKLVLLFSAMRERDFPELSASRCA
jgi:NADP-dependent 3-hydroxy acid dehydrogenase YdfG